ncbi:type IV pilus modification protein PilV [Thauera propionica]|uniref:Type IV pilus modification protein PilV n=1 Tax=Thauera propionica TaxID=2019431 RepID=A0A235EZP9_9RHOO|nr:type IV pilus modification protein PilV [Thauera propionica]OYD54441.1 type IV pilus modification protein PilV [Thauera propionica]
MNRRILTAGRSLVQVRQCGASLLEVLIALVVLSLGLLGLAGLQVASLKANQDAGIRTQASILAYQIIDSVRANPARIADYNYNLDFGSDEDDEPDAAGVAGEDLDEWVQRVASLPGGEGQVCQADDPAIQIDDACPENGDYVRVVIRWTALDENGRDRAAVSMMVVGHI